VKPFHLGPLSVDPAEYASHGNAVLGIRASGKSYSATYIAERLFEAGVPFVAFDPIGIWRYLRVPGAGRGYPVVVAGGAEPDLPLTVEGAPALVRAAMQNGVSLVIDLFDMKLSKADWRKIVTAAVRTLLHENHTHGLRHVFIEEAAEFIPQRPLDPIVYAEVEKLARMGGNSRLGYTLINQRSQEVSKAILELCENVFLHRQRGKNALENMDKWLQVAGAAEQREIMRTLPDLPQGECWAWLGGDHPTPPTRIKVPAKNSFHPDRRAVRGDTVVAKAAPVDVGEFVAGMRGQLDKIVAETAANDPKALRAEIAKLRAELAKKAPAEVPQHIIRDAEARGWREGRTAGAAEVRRMYGERIQAFAAALDAASRDLLAPMPTLEPTSLPATGGVTHRREPFVPASVQSGAVPKLTSTRGAMPVPSSPPCSASSTHRLVAPDRPRSCAHVSSPASVRRLRPSASTSAS
jgi:hypothetical protein